LAFFALVSTYKNVCLLIDDDKKKKLAYSFEFLTILKFVVAMPKNAPVGWAYLPAVWKLDVLPQGTTGSYFTSVHLSRVLREVTIT
jgi:hypothetical protein